MPDPLGKDHLQAVGEDAQDGLDLALVDNQRGLDLDHVRERGCRREDDPALPGLGDQPLGLGRRRLPRLRIGDQLGAQEEPGAADVADLGILGRG